jgi:predicted transcriptional regulator
MTNLTVTIDDALLQRAREAAVRENTSVNALVRDFLIRYVDARSQRLQALENFESVAAASGSRSQVAWNRESLHQRG